MDNDTGVCLLNWVPSIIGMALLLVIGTLLILITVKRRVKGKLKTYQLIASAFALGLPIFGGLLYLTYEMWLAPIFFVLALLICPVGLLVGGIGSIVIRIRHRRNGVMACWIGGFLLLIFGVSMRMIIHGPVWFIGSWVFIALGSAFVITGLFVFLKGRQKPT